MREFFDTIYDLFSDEESGFTGTAEISCGVEKHPLDGNHTELPYLVIDTGPDTVKSGVIGYPSRDQNRTGKFDVLIFVEQFDRTVDWSSLYQAKEKAEKLITAAEIFIDSIHDELEAAGFVNIRWQDTAENRAITLGQNSGVRVMIGILKLQVDYAVDYGTVYAGMPAIRRGK